jgi:hypothetical protein
VGGLPLLADNFEIPPESIWECAAEMLGSRLDSLIISDFLAIFAEFRGKRFSVLWRGSRDGFRASQFRRRSAGQPNTLPVIVDTTQNIFGRFTPLNPMPLMVDPAQLSFIALFCLLALILVSIAITCCLKKAIVANSLMDGCE